ncbi:MAG: LemA family protein [Polyangiales bacterium]
MNLALCSIAVALGVLAMLTPCLLYNKLAALRSRLRHAYAQVDLQLLRRHDLIGNLVETVRRHLAHEHDTLEAVVHARGLARGAMQAARGRVGAASTMSAVAEAEGVLDAGLGRMLALGEAYPTLRANDELRGLREALTVTENKVAFARQAYNDAVCRYNGACASFPALAVAAILGFEPALPLEVIEHPIERAPVRSSLS